jgi:hypothetical protein
MKRYIAQFDTSVKNAEDIIQTLASEHIEVEKYFKNIDVYLLRSEKDLVPNEYLSSVYRIDKSLTINEEE